MSLCPLQKESWGQEKGAEYKGHENLEIRAGGCPCDCPAACTFSGTSYAPQRQHSGQPVLDPDRKTIASAWAQAVTAQKEQSHRTKKAGTCPRSPQHGACKLCSCSLGRAVWLMQCPADGVQVKALPRGSCSVPCCLCFAPSHSSFSTEHQLWDLYPCP